MERISIKNVEYSEALSEETNAFVADVYLDNKKFGYAKNDGHGGQTFISPYPNKGEELKLAHEYANSLPDVNYGNFTMKSTLDGVVDDLLVKHLEAKAIKKDMKKGILYRGENGGIKLLSWKNFTLAKLLKHPKGNEVIGKAVKELREKGFEILNTNLPKELLD